MTTIRRSLISGRPTTPCRRGIRIALVAIAIIAATALTAHDADAHGRGRRYNHQRNHNSRVVVVRQTAPRYVVVQPSAPRYVVIQQRAPRYTVAPGYVGSPVVSCGPDRFHWSVSLGLYVPNLWLEAGYGEWAPRGSVYWDPYCATSYRCLSDYRTHLHECGHPAALMLAAGGPVCR